MASAKRLNSVCHSIAHQAVSGLSYVHPHVLATCCNSGVEEMTVDLLDSRAMSAAVSCDPAALSIFGWPPGEVRGHSHQSGIFVVRFQLDRGELRDLQPAQLRVRNVRKSSLAPRSWKSRSAFSFWCF